MNVETRLQAQLMDDGPRPRQKTLLIILWIGKGSRKKFFFSRPATKALSPPLELSGHIFLELQKKFF